MCSYIFVEHTADAKFIASGKSLEEAFENSAAAMLSIIAKHDSIKPTKKKQIAVSSDDIKGLLYSFLEELLFLIDAEGFIASGFEKTRIEKTGSSYKLRTTALGSDITECETHGEVKAVTYNDMEIEETSKGWKAIVVVDL